MAAAVAELLSLVLPGRCAACGARAARLCPGCRVAVLASRFPGGARTVSPSPRPQGLPSTWAAAPLEQPLRGLVTSFKDEGRRDLAGLLGALLAGAVREAVAHGSVLGGAGVHGAVAPVALVPVPASARSRRRRGDRPLDQVASVAAGLLPGQARVVPALRPTRRTRDQSGLDHRERAVNVGGSMALVPGGRRLLEGHVVVLVDDIMTTGATLCEAARAVREGPASPVAAVVAATARRLVETGPKAD